jgi:hypothetical protein
MAGRWAVSAHYVAGRTPTPKRPMKKEADPEHQQKGLPKQPLRE